MPVSREPLYRSACAAMFVFGVVLALPGTVLALPAAVDRFHLTLANRGALISALFVGLLAGSFASSATVDRLGHRLSLVTSCALVAACLPLFAVAPTYPWALLALVGIGVAAAGVNTASNALSSDLFPEERGRRMNGLAVAVGLGGLSMPAGTALTASVLPWSGVVYGSAVLAALVAAWGSRAPASPQAVARSQAPMGGAVLRQPGFAWFALLVMLAAGTESSMAGFTSTYLSEAGFTPIAATWGLTSHWVGLIVGRLLLAGRVDREQSRAVQMAAGLGALLILLLAWVPNVLVLGAAPFLIGVAISIVMPTSLALGGERIVGQAGALFGLLLTVAQAGAILLPTVVGMLAGAAGVGWALTAVAVNSVLAALVCAQASRRSGAQPPIRT